MGGSSITNVEPLPTPALSAVMRPPCNSTRCRSIASPSAIQSMYDDSPTQVVLSFDNYVAQIDGADRQPHPSRYKLTRIHQVVNQLPKRIRVAIDGRNRALDAVGPHRVLFEHARPPDYRGRRRAKFV